MTVWKHVKGLYNNFEKYKSIFFKRNNNKYQIHKAI